MKKGFTILEVSILLVIFLIVAFLVAPMSFDNTKQAKLTSKWRTVQEDFINIFYAINTQKEDEGYSFSKALQDAIQDETKENIKTYKVSYLDGTYPSNTYRFSNYRLTYANAVIALKLFEVPQGNHIGMLMYDVNGSKGPNTWGKDVFGLDLYYDKFSPFGSADPLSVQKQDCSKNGSGIACSNYYLIGGNFD